MFKGNFKEDKLQKLQPKNEKQVFPINHYDLVRNIRRFSDKNQTVEESEVALDFNGTDLLAAFHIVDPSCELGEGVKLWLGVLNSNSSHRASRFFGGVTIKGSPIVMNRYQNWRHKAGLDIVVKTKYAFDMLALQGPEYPIRFAEMRRRKLSPEEVDLILFKAMREKIVGHRKILEISNNLKILTEGKSTTAWTLCLAFGKAVIKGEPLTNNPMRDHLNRMFAFRKLAMTNGLAI